MEHTNRFHLVLVVAASAAILATPGAAAQSALVEFRAVDGTQLVAPGDARSTPLRVDPAARRKRVEARAEAIAVARDAFLASLSPRTAARVTGVYRHFPLVALQGDAASLAELAANRLVVAVHEDRLRRPYVRSSLAYMGASSWHGEGHVGAGTSVAVLDTGIRYWNGRFGTCEAPGAEGCRVLAFEGFARLRGGTGTTDPRRIAESEPHGTNVGGIVAEVAPGTGLLSLTVFALYDPDPSSGFGGGVLASDGDVVRALDWAVDRQVEYGIVAANMSLGSEVDSDARGYCTGWLAGAYPTAFANCRDAGILPVVATGNEYSKTAVSSPACVAAAVRVGAGYDDPAFGYGCGTGPVVPGAVVCFSNSNALVDLIAPGYDIDAGGLYGYSGTSMAAPHAAGLAAAYQARYGTDPIWTLQRMRVDAVPVAEAYREQPYVHRYVRMGDHDAVLRFDTGAVLASSFRGIFIPDGDPAGIEVSAEVICDVDACASDSVGRVYVDLAVDHWNNDDLAIEMEAPDGTVARHDVAGNAELGRYGLNSILGSQHLPGAFDALRLKPIAGVWKLRVRDETPGNTGSLHRAVLLIDSARVLLEAGLDAPRIARPGRAFPVRVTMVNAGNMDIAAAPLRLEMADRAGGAVAVAIPFEVDTPIAPGERLEVELDVIGTRQGEFDLRVATSGLDPGLPPGLRSESRRVFVTDRTFAAFAVDPALPAPGTPATLVDLSVGLVGSHRWDFGDDATSTDASPTHSWAAEGEYVVTLTVTGPDGASTAAQRVLVVEPPALSAIGSGCECRAPGSAGRSGAGAAAVAFLLACAAAWRRRRLAVAVACTVAALAAAGCEESGPVRDGGDAYRRGPWVSLLDPADPSEGDIDIHVRVGHERSLPLDLAIEFSTGGDEFRAITPADPAAAVGVASAPGAGVEHVVRWRTTADLPGDAEGVRVRVVALDGEIESVPVVSAPFSVLNFFVTRPNAVLIAEVSTAERNVPGSARDDYVELLNTTDEDLPLDGWRLVVAGSGGGRDEFPLDGVVVPAGGRVALVEAEAEYRGGRPLDRDLPWTIAGYGSVALVATYDRGVDFVRWGGSSEPPPRGETWADDAPLPVPQTLTVLNRVDERGDADRASDFCVAAPSPDAPSSGCLPRFARGSVLVTELDSQSADDQVEVLNRSDETLDLAGWVLMWDGSGLGSGEVPLASVEIAPGGRLGLRDNGTAGRVSGSVMELGVNLSLDGLIPIAVGFKDPYGQVVDFLASGGSTIRWLDWEEVEPTPMPGPGTTLSRRPGDPDTDSAADFCLTTPNVGAPPGPCLEPLGIVLVITEVMPGRPDWVEIRNPGPDPVDLSRVYLSYTSPYYGGSVEDYPLSGTLAPGGLVVVTERDLPGVDGEIVIRGNIALATEGDGSVALRDAYGFGIDFVMWGEPSGRPLWPDAWSGLGADVYDSDVDSKSIQRLAVDAPDTNRRDDWCWADPSPGGPNRPCE